MTDQSHALFVPLVDPSGIAQQTTGYVDGVLSQLWRRGIAVEVHRIRPKDLRNRRVLGALRQRGIDRLPALIAAGHSYVGLRDIRRFYDAVLSERRAGSRAPGRTAPRAPGRAPVEDLSEETTANDTAEEELDAFYRQEMRVGRLGGEIDTRGSELDND